MEKIGIGFKEESSKFLGMILDELCTWKQFIKHINSKSLYNQASQNYFYTGSLKTYFALIQLHINYGILAWGNATKCILKHTVVLQSPL